MKSNLGRTTNTALTPSARLAQEAQSLHEMHSLRASDNVDTDEVSQPKTAIQRLLQRYKNDPSHQEPVSLRDYLARMQTLPRLAGQQDSINGFTKPGDMNQSTLRLATGLITSRLQRSGRQKEMDKPVNMVREMLLLCFEAKPRPLSYAMGGYTVSDFIAYIYQDVATKDMGLSANERERPFIELVDDIKTWLRIPPPLSSTNTARRHVRRRIMVTMDRSNHQVSALMEDREMPSEVLLLVQKLLERDDDQGYTVGELRDFREARDDLNALAEFCVRRRYEPGSVKVEDLEMVCCPSEVSDFSQLTIQRPRGRRANSASKKSSKLNRTTAPRKTASAPLTKTRPKNQVHETRSEDDFGLDALKSLI
jgi:hypothetical protein